MPPQVFREVTREYRGLVLVGVSDPTAEAVTAEFQAYLGTLATGAGASSLGAKVLEKTLANVQPKSTRAA